MKQQLEIPDNVAVSFFKNQLNGVAISNVFHARCEVCGDSENNRHRKRMYLLKKDRTWFVYCHNCGYSSSLLKFAKDFHPSQYDYLVNQSVNEFLFASPKLTKKDKDLDMQKMIKRITEKIEKKLKLKTPVEKHIEENCVRLTSSCGKIELQAQVDVQIKLLRKRRLSEEFVKSLYYAYTGNYKDRVLIPFFNKDGQVYYFQAKGTKDYHKSNKYINWTEDSKKKNMDRPEYNEYHVNKEETVWIIEGLLDSLFVDNSVSTLSATLSAKKINTLKKKYPKRIWIMDNDREGISKTKKLLLMDESCVIFPKKYKKIKDLNDLAIFLEKDNLTEIIKPYAYNSIEGIIQLGV